MSQATNMMRVEEGGFERNAAALEGVRNILIAIGENPKRAGLEETPMRFLKAFHELTAGIRSDPKTFLKKQFPLDDVPDSPSSYDDIIMSGPLPFVSLCEHHLLPFSGVAWIGYLPKEKSAVVGLSKLARLLDGYSLRLQVQERLTRQIADAIQDVLKPAGVGVVIKATHSCQCFRGVKKAGEMKTSAMLGCFREQGSARAEFMSLLAI